jgi:hypothetical protein
MHILSLDLFDFIDVFGGIWVPDKSSSIPNTIRQIQCNKDSFKFSFFCRTIKDWNKLPEHITNSTSTEIFRERLTHDVLKDNPNIIYSMNNTKLLLFFFQYGKSST